jgi:thiaminase
LEHLVQLYDSGQWKNFYKEDNFADAVRQARQLVDHWTSVVAKAEDA